MSSYFRPLVRSDRSAPDAALPVAGGPRWFTHAERLDRDGTRTLVDLDAIPPDMLTAITAPRPAICGLTMDRPRIMGILNVTPDSFSDGGQHASAAKSTAHGRRMVADGADLIDVGGESTRPGAETVPVPAEISRVEPVIRALRHAVAVPISIDTRKSCVAKAAVDAGATLVNDVSGFTHDKMLAPYCARHDLPVCVMHARGDPETMQADPRYDDVLLDVYDFLAAQVAMLEEAGLPRAQVLIDPGIGFGKTVAHNLALLHGIALFHGIGCPILLGASRKGFIGKLSHTPDAAKRAPGSIAVALAAVAQGVQVLRVHDVAETRAALNLWQAVETGETHGA
ncbi:dihydropteroate synthase [Thalassococcus sp. BH17M4-6]|uniref:dihydropteroate synthase n=1 Tax=Thalassococcus sp. BH17M4-6 TaxID=3413148 RepID=UPI003BE0A999